MKFTLKSAEFFPSPKAKGSCRPIAKFIGSGLKSHVSFQGDEIGRPMRRSRSAKRGSLRSGSSRGSTPAKGIHSERARYAFSNQEKASSFSPNDAYKQPTAKPQI